MEDDEIMRQINAKATGNDDDLDNELAGLEDEIEKEEGKQQNSDDELANLEKEDLDNIEEEEEKAKPEKKPEQKSVPQTQPKKESSSKIISQKNKEPESKTKKVENSNNQTKNDNDLYPEKVEKRYHEVNKMNSLGVLEKEKELCDKIISIKKKSGADYDIWEDKKDAIKDQNDLIMGYIQNQVWDFETYKKKIKEQYIWEKKLLQFVEMDKSLNLNQKNVIKERVNNRIKIIEDELTRNPDEEIEKEEKEKKEKKEKEKIKRLTEIITERLNEYREALEYFKINDFPDLQKQAINKINKINFELRKIQVGKSNEVNEFDLPGSIAPEFIYGHDKKERDRRFKQIISEMSKEKDLMQEEMNNKMDTLKEMPKEKSVYRKDPYNIKEKKDNIENIISLLREKFQDKWVPAPLFFKKEEESSIEKINVNIPENTLRIIFGKTNYIKKKKLHLNIKISNYNLEKTFEQKVPGD